MTVPLVLLTGATGYVGGRLLAELERRGVALRCFVRRPESLRGRAAPSTALVAGDALDAATVARALQGVDAAYYLIHSMGGEHFAARDLEAARIFGATARKAGVKRIIYLGGLGEAGSGLSEHLRSRQETGDILRGSGVPVVELRASIVLGSGSLSFEMIRALVERLPVMICPRWVAVEAQPIAVEDVVAYLAAALDLPAGAERVYEIGGPDRVTYGGLMREYARQRGLKRLLIPVPLLTPRLSSLWLGLVTPLYARVGRKLADSMRNPTVIRDPAALAAFPVKPRGVREAIARALVNEDEALARTRWSDAVSSSGLTERYGGDRVGTRFIDSRKTVVPVSPAAAFAPIRRIGGDSGWYYGRFLWRLRGFADLLAGGIGLRRGRRHPTELQEGDALDFWRVEAVEPDRLLRLRAEMKVPGRAWLQFETAPAPDGTEIRQTAIFDASGLLGLAYWYALYPLHRFVFAGMLRGIADRARLAGAAMTSMAPLPQA
ncbi:MAG TPA: SDR family oxidoreductase [Thermoanaerobaculia bacterium]|nr:SDR family oxidoreductase [Thermoanaerobaculia bacterium]